MTPEQLDMHKRLQPLYKRVMGRWQQGDKGICTVHQASYLFDCFGFDEYCCDEEGLRIPLTIDSEHSERGLWEMLKGEKMIEESKSYCIVWHNDNAIEASDPTTAILKALCEQEGV